MEGGFDMSSTVALSSASRNHSRKNLSAILLSAAALLVIAAAFAGMILSAQLTQQNSAVHVWGLALYVLLATILIATLLGIAAFAQLTRERNPATHTWNSAKGLRLIFIALLLFHAAVALLLCRPGSSITIDTFTFQRDASRNLLHGIDPYGATQADTFDPYQTAIFYGPGMVVNGRVQVGFQYPPLTLLWVLPGYILGDVRWSYIFAVIVSAVFLFALSPNKHGLWIAAVLLLSPLTFSVEFLCWTEPLVLMTLSATAYAAVRKRWWLPVVLGLFLATKQYNFLALPFIAYFVIPFRWKQYWKLTGLSLAVGVATALPFVFWNPRGLWHDTVLFHLAQPFRQDAVSFAVLFPVMMKIGPLLLLAFIVWAVQSKRHNPAMFPAAYGIALLIFVATSKQAFANYYFLIAHALLLAAVALLADFAPPQMLPRRDPQVPFTQPEPASE